jgi:hypothetical protein
MATTPEVDWAEKWPKKVFRKFFETKESLETLKSPFHRG